jgi:hypothetical protein
VFVPLVGHGGWADRDGQAAPRGREHGREGDERAGREEPGGGRDERAGREDAEGGERAASPDDDGTRWI